jgi:hypothetical protein
MTALTPPDRKQCQAEKPNPDFGPFRMGGSTKKRVRCGNTPTTIATETEPGKDGHRGSMSMCDDCVAVAKLQLPKDFCTFKPMRKLNPKKVAALVTAHV